MSKKLFEVVEDAWIVLRETGQRGVVTHRTEGFFPAKQILNKARQLVGFRWPVVEGNRVASATLNCTDFH